MKRIIIIVLISLLLFGLCSFGYEYQWGGLKQFIRAVSLIQKLPVEKQTTVRESFYGTRDNEYGGILSGVSTRVIKGIWVWGKSGLRFFAIDQYSVYSSYLACKGVLDKLETNKYKELSIDRMMYGNADEWAKAVTAGDYVDVIITKTNMGGTTGNLREILAYDWWNFLQSNLETECAK